MAVAKKSDVNTEQGKQIIEQIDANIERARVLATEGNEEAVKELGEETEALISSLAGKGSIKIKQEKRTAWYEATEKKKTEIRHVIQGEVTKEIQDPYTIEGMRELVTLGAEKFAEGARLHLKIKDTAIGVAKVILDQRLRIPNKEGIPDLKATSNAAKQVSSDTYEKAREALISSGVSEKDAEASIHKLMRGVHNYIKGVIFDYFLSLDNDPEEAKRWEMVASEGKPLSEAAAALYGWKLPKELTSGNGQATGQAVAQLSNKEEPATQVLSYFQRAKGELSKAGKRFKTLSEEDQAKVKAEIDALVTELVALKARL